MAWEDDDPEEESGPLAVANALAGNKEGAVPEDMPDTVSRTQPVEGEQDDTEQQMIEPQKGQDPVIPEDGMQASPDGGDDDEQAMTQSQPEAAESTSGVAGLKSPTLPTLPKYEDELAAHQQLESDMRSVNPANYKPSVGRQILGRLAAGLSGDASVGRNVIDRPLNQARTAQAATVAADKQALTDMATRNAQSRQQYTDAGQQFQNEELDMRNQGYVANQNAQAGQRRATAQRVAGQVRPETMAPDDPNNPLGGWHGVDGTGKRVTGLSTPDAYLKTPAGKAAVIEDTIKRARDAGHPFTPEQESVVRSGGHVTIKNPTNIHVPSAESEKYNDWKSSFARDNKRPPNAAEISGYGHTTSGAMSKSLGDRIDSQKNTQISKAQSDFNNGLIDKDEYLGKWQAAQDEYEQRLQDATGGEIPHVVVKDNVDANGVWHGRAPATPKASPAQPQQRPAAQPQQPKYTVGQPVKVDGKDYVVKGINPQTGKPIVGAP